MADSLTSLNGAPIAFRKSPSGIPDRQGWRGAGQELREGTEVVGDGCFRPRGLTSRGSGGAAPRGSIDYLRIEIPVLGFYPSEVARYDERTHEP